MIVVIIAAVFSGCLLFYSASLLMIDLLNSRRQRTRGRLDQDLRRQTERLPIAVHVFDVLDEVVFPSESGGRDAAASWFQRFSARLGQAGVRIGPRQLVPAWAGLSLGIGVLAAWLTGEVVVAGIVANGLVVLPLFGFLFVVTRRVFRFRKHLPEVLARMVGSIRSGRPFGPTLQAAADELLHGPRSLAADRTDAPERTEVELSSGAQLARVVQGPGVGNVLPPGDLGLTTTAQSLEGAGRQKIVARLAEDGTLVSIRRVRSTSLVVDDLLRQGVLTSEMMIFLVNCVRARINLLICGGKSAGKRTMLNVLSHFIPPTQRVAVIASGDELRMAPLNVVRMETRPRLFDDPGEDTVRELVRNCLSAEPERIIITDCGGAEMRDLFAAMRTSCCGSLITIEARTPRDAVTRLEMMLSRTDGDLPSREIRHQIASSIGLMVQISRVNGGVHRVTRITEITGMEGDAVAMSNIFEFVQTGLDEQRVSKGYFRTTGMQPLCLGRLDEYGVGLSSDLFERRQLEPLILGGVDDL